MNVLLDEIIGMDEDSFSGFPFAATVRSWHSAHFHLTRDGTSEASAGNSQEFASVDVTKLNL